MHVRESWCRATSKHLSRPLLLHFFFFLSLINLLMVLASWHRVLLPTGLLAKWGQIIAQSNSLLGSTICDIMIYPCFVIRVQEKQVSQKQAKLNWTSVTELRYQKQYSTINHTCFAAIVYFFFFLHAIISKPKINTIATCNAQRLMSSGMGWGHNNGCIMQRWEPMQGHAGTTQHSFPFLVKGFLWPS